MVADVVCPLIGQGTHPAGCPYGERITASEHSVKDIDKKLDAIIERLDRQNGRVDKLEAWRDRAIGFGAAIIVAMPVATAILGNWLR